MRSLINLRHDGKRPFYFLLFVLGLVVLGMLYLGIRLKGFRPRNKVKWSNAGVGLSFHRFAEAYSDSVSLYPAGAASAEGLTIEIAIQPPFVGYPEFRFILLAHDGDDERQLLIGQWRSSLIIMNGDDYSNKHRTPKIYCELGGLAHAPHLVTIVSHANGTRLYFDGILKKQNPELALHLPDHKHLVRLVVGNSLDGERPWIGKILGLALYDRLLEDKAVLQHFQAWRKEPDFNVFRKDAPHLLYAFDEGRGEKVYNKIGQGPDLIVPRWIKVLQPKMLAWPKLDSFISSSMATDMSVNFIGFIPLGFLLTAILRRIKGGIGRSAWLIAVLIAFLFSLGMEIVQVWIPTRDSSMLDLILNTLGGSTGGLITLRMEKFGKV